MTLRFQAPGQSNGDRQTVSVAEMLVPKKARSFYQKARGACARGNFDEAQELLDRALEIHPQFAEALTLRGLLQLKTNHIDQGRQNFEQAIQYDPNYGPAYVGLAAAYNAQAHYDDALRTLERETTISPTAWQGYLEMAKASIGKGMYDQGLQYAEKADQLNGKHLAGHPFAQGIRHDSVEILQSRQRRIAGLSAARADRQQRRASAPSAGPIRRRRSAGRGEVMGW